MSSISNAYDPPQRIKEFINRHARIILLAPTLIAMSTMMIFPVFYTLYLTFYNWFASSLVPPRFVGLENYMNLLTDLRFIKAIGRTIYYTAASVFIEFVIGIAVALTFNREFKGKGLARTIFLLPIMATPVAISLTWTMLLDPVSGILNYILSLLHLPTSLWASDPSTVILSLVMVDVWKWTPLVMLIVLGGLSTQPTEPHEAALIDGARPWQDFFYITLPLLRPILMVALLLRTIDALKTFDIIFVITEGGPGFASETLNIYCFNQAFAYFHMGYASTALVIFFLIVLGVSLLFIRLRRQKF